MTFSSTQTATETQRARAKEPAFESPAAPRPVAESVVATPAPSVDSVAALSRWKSAWRTLRHWAPGWCVSASLHSLLLVGLGLIVVAVEPSAHSDSLVGSFTREDSESEASEAAVVELNVITTVGADPNGLPGGSRPAAPNGGAVARGLLAQSAVARLDVAPVESEFGPAPGGLGGSVAADIAAAVGQGEALDGVVTGPPGGGGTGPVVGKGKASFFGIEAKGYKFVYIVDASGSMFGRRFAKALNELHNSLAELDEHQSFYVIFFSSTEFPMFYPIPEPKLLPVSPTNLERTGDWIKRHVIPSGETIPNSALSRALALQPDAIFFLSDGEFSEGAMFVVQQENYRRIPIHTIAFESQVGAFSLRQIAGMTGGSYRFVQ